MGEFTFCDGNRKRSTNSGRKKEQVLGKSIGTGSGPVETECLNKQKKAVGVFLLVLLGLKNIYRRNIRCNRNHGHTDATK